QHPIRAIVDARIPRDVGEVGANQRELLRARHALHLIQPLDRAPLEQITPERVHRVRRVRDHAARLQRLDGTANLPRIRILRLNFYEQPTPSSSTSKWGVAMGGTAPGKPRAPYARSGGQMSVRRPPTFIDITPSSQPLITWPMPMANTNGWPR